MVKNMTEPRGSHPSDEWLIAYLTTGLSGHERQGVEVHVRACDVCVGTLATMQRRLSWGPEVGAPVPATLVARATAGVPTSPAAGPIRAPWGAALLERLRHLVPLPILVPVAVAATAIVVLTSHSDITSRAPHPQSRAVEMQQALPVTALEAAVWPRPEPPGTAGDRAIATVRRGTKLLVVGESGEWYRVTLPDGRNGWVERHAFE